MGSHKKKKYGGDRSQDTVQSRTADLKVSKKNYGKRRSGIHHSAEEVESINLKCKASSYFAGRLPCCYGI